MISFWLWLDGQPPDRQREIRSAERLWVKAHYSGVAEDPSISDYLESFIGYEDPPAGKVS